MESVQKEIANLNDYDNIIGVTLTVSIRIRKWVSAAEWLKKLQRNNPAYRKFDIYVIVTF